MFKLVHWAMQDCLYKTETAIRDLLNNFPRKALRQALRLIVMPFGRRVTKPSDKIEHQIAHIIQTPCAARSRIGYGQYMAKVEGNMLGELEQTLEDIIAVEPIFERLCKSMKQKLSFTQLDIIANDALAKGLINEQEALLFKKAEAGRLKAINVDDFDPSELVAGNAKRTKATRKPAKTVKAA